MDINQVNTEKIIPKNKRYFKTKLFFSLIIFLLGLVVLTISGLKIYSYYEVNDDYLEVIGEVISHEYNNDGLRAVVISYKINDEQYEIKSKKYVKNPEAIGSYLPIRYNNKNHKDIVWKYNKISIVIPIIAGVVAFIGFGLVIATIKRRFKKEEVKEEIKQEDMTFHDENLEIKESKKTVRPDQQTLGSITISSNNDEL